MTGFPRPEVLLSELVRRRSFSGEEHAALDCLAEALAGAGVSPERIGRNLVARHGEGEPVLWLTSHLDTVRPGEGWSFDPWSGEITADGRVRGLGANDAKGSVAAMACAFVRFRELHPELAAGTLALVAVCDEETGGEGLEWLRKRLARPDAAVVGEPNGLAVANCCKGLVRATVRVRGRAAHASRPWQGQSAMRLALPVLERLLAAQDFPADPALGPPTLEVTMISGGHQKNALPALVTLTLDARTTPGFDNRAMVERLRCLADGLAGCELEVASDRLAATRTPADGRLVRAALAARRQSAPVAFNGVCDFVHLGDTDAAILGPGAPERSHQADEWLGAAELEDGVVAYLETLHQFFFLVW